ncbi:MAG: transposase [Octadecabacter sp.]|nr:transposase [Octadecabacter sp.]
MLDDGIARRRPRRRSVEEKLSIVAESYASGETVAGVARRHGIVPSQLSGWRSAARSGRLSSSQSWPTQFAKVAVAADAEQSGFQMPPEGVEIVVGAVLVRLPNSTPPKRIGDIARRLSDLS